MLKKYFRYCYKKMKNASGIETEKQNYSIKF